MRSKLRASSSSPPDQDGPVLSNGDPRFLKFFLFGRERINEGHDFSLSGGGDQQKPHPRPFRSAHLLGRKVSGYPDWFGRERSREPYQGVRSQSANQTILPQTNAFANQGHSNFIFKLDGRAEFDPHETHHLRIQSARPTSSFEGSGRDLEIRNPRTHARVKSVLKKNFPFWFGQGLLTAPHLPQFIRITVDRHACVFKRQILGLPYGRHPKSPGRRPNNARCPKARQRGSQVVLDPLGSCIHNAGKERKVFLNPQVPGKVAFSPYPLRTPS